MTGGRARLAAAMAVPLLLGACANPDGAPTDEAPGPGGVGGGAEGVATYDARGAGGMDALLAGTLVVEDGCLYVGSADLDERWLPVFPAADVRWDGETLTFAGGTHRAGDRVELAGGVVTEPTSRRPVAEEYDIPPACSTEFVWLVAPG